VSSGDSFFVIAIVMQLYHIMMLRTESDQLF